MSVADAVEIRLRPNGVTISGGVLFSDPTKGTLREFLSRAFSLPETKSVVLEHGKALAEIRFEPDGAGAQPWLRLAKVLKGHTADRTIGLLPSIPVSAESLALDGDAADGRVRITRTGNTLSSWRVRAFSSERLRISHPKLQRRDIAFRLQEHLASTHGVTSYRTIPSGFEVDIDPSVISAEQLVGAFERAWPQLLRGFEPPAFPTKLVLSIALLAGAVTAQYVVPALTPFVLVAAATYGFPNVLGALRQLRRGQIGLPVLYATGLGFMLWTRSPLSSAIMAVFMQTWPRIAEWASHSIARSLFLGQRRKVVWARKRADGEDVIVASDDIVAGDLICVRTGEYVPADGIVEDGLAAIDEDMFTGVAGAIDKAPGDAVHAATFVRAGEIVVRVTAAGENTAARIIAARLPRGELINLPSSAQAEYVANRNAKPALALAVACMLATRAVRPSQALIRPDYATGPRLSAQLSSLSAIATAVRHGIFVKTHSAIDRLLAANVYVFDESAYLSGKALVVAGVQPADAGNEFEVLKFAAAAFATRTDQRALALSEELARQGIVVSAPARRRRLAGAIRFDSASGAEIDVASTAYVARSQLPIPGSLVALLAADLGTNGTQDVEQRAVWVIRDGRIFGAVRFAREAVIAPSVITNLARANRGSQFIYLSSAPQRVAAAAAKSAGIETVFGGLSDDEKADKVRTISRKTVWIGDGAHPANRSSLQASAVSISTAGLADLNADRADVVLLQRHLTRIVNLRQIAHAHLARLRSDYRTVYLCNVAAAAGGFVAGFGGLQAGLASNFGTGLVLSSRWLELKSIIQDLKARDAVRQSTLVEELPPLELEPVSQQLDGDIVFDLPEADAGFAPIDGI